jgi:hypothetical protein
MHIVCLAIGAAIGVWLLNAACWALGSKWRFGWYEHGKAVPENDEAVA